MLRRAQALDPLGGGKIHNLTLALTYGRQFDEAQIFADRMQTLWPKQAAAYWDRVWLLVAWERWDDAIALMLSPTAPPEATNQHQIFAQALRSIKSGDARALPAARDGLLGIARRGTGYASYAMIVLARLGLADESTMLAKALYLKASNFQIDRTMQFVGAKRYLYLGENDPLYLFHPFMAPLRRSGALKPVFDGLGLTDFWRQSGPPDA